MSLSGVSGFIKDSGRSINSGLQSIQSALETASDLGITKECETFGQQVAGQIVNDLSEFFKGLQR